MAKCPVCEKEFTSLVCPNCGFAAIRNHDGAPYSKGQSATRESAQNRPVQYSRFVPQQNYVQQQGYAQQQSNPQYRQNLQDPKAQLPKQGKAGGSSGKKAGILIILICILGLALGIFLVLMFGGEKDPCANGHQMTTATCTAPKTCSVCGETEGSVLAHTMSAATCTAPKTCSECGKTEGNALGHDWLPATCEKPETCSLCGKAEGSALGHNPTEATYNDPSICSRCEQKLGSPKVPSSPLSLSNIIKSSKASSVYSGDDLGTHSPKNLYDGWESTNWTEGVKGYGIGEYVILNFDGTYAVKSLTILIGSHYQGTTTYYEKNGRPSELLLTFSDGSTYTVHLKDTAKEQTISFDQYYYTDSIKLTIKDVYPGTTYEDTIIAELDFAAYRP